jgi:hypothetical protein
VVVPQIKDSKNLRSVRLLQAAAAGSRNPRNQTLTLRSINNGDADLAARSDFRPKSPLRESKDRSKEAFECRNDSIAGTLRNR